MTILRRSTTLLCIVLLCSAGKLAAAPINFSGQLDIIERDDGGASYSGVPLGTTFTGVIDDVTANGNITDGTTPTVFGCCIFAGALELNNDVVIDAATAAQGNLLAGTNLFNDGDVIDLVDLEGDVMTASGGRIEIGLSFVLQPTAFNSVSLSNYPFDPSDLLLSLFFILEEDSNGVDIYSALGALDSVTLQSPSQAPLPATLWLLAGGLLLTAGVQRRRG